MKRFINNLSTNAKLILSFGILLVLLAVVIVMAYRGITNVTQSEVRLRDVHSKEAVQLQALRADMNFNMWKLHEILLSTDRSEQDAVNTEIQGRSQEMDDIVVLLTSLNPDPVFQSELQELGKYLADYRQKRDQIIALAFAGKVDEAHQLSRQYEAEGYYESVRLLAVQIGDEAIAKMDQQLAADQQAARSDTILFLVIGGVTLLLAVGMVVLLNQTIAKPLTGITKVAEQIGGGDLSVNLPEELRRDEIGVLTRAFRQMVENLRRSTAEISEAVNLLGSSASEILAATTQVASGTAETAAAINETTTTVEEVRHEPHP
jgi:nitrogen fixation/metabolism regulation signal transduction histidine kinase